VAVLRDGGNAIDAVVAAVAVLAVVAPTTAGLGGDGFWLIAEPGKPPVSIDGSGAAARLADAAAYGELGFTRVPVDGPWAALSVAGAVSGWQLALDVSAQWGPGLPLERLLADSVALARDGVAAAGGGTVTRPALAATLERLAAAGLDDFYRGDVARLVADDLKAAGAPVRAEDLARHRGMRRRPLSLGVGGGTVFTTAPPTQGLASLVTLGLAQRLPSAAPGGEEWTAGLARAARQGLAVRDAHLADPAAMQVHATTYLSDHLLDRMAAALDSAPPLVAPAFAAHPAAWIGAVDGQGRAVSCVHGLGPAGGAGLDLPASGIRWHAAGAGFSLGAERPNPLEPRRRPRHSLCPGLARLKDGRVALWGGGDGQSQALIQAQLVGRLLAGATAGEALAAPRAVFTADGLVADDPAQPPAGLMLRLADGTLESGIDPRGDGAVAGY
jgi:gamma-glutamyltranspeptidase/glutathione hydrolase